MSEKAQSFVRTKAVSIDDAQDSYYLGLTSSIRQTDPSVKTQED